MFEAFAAFLMFLVVVAVVARPFLESGVEAPRGGSDGDDIEAAVAARRAGWSGR